MSIKENNDESNGIEINGQNPLSDNLILAFEEVHEDMQGLLKRNNVVKHARSSLFIKKENLSIENELLNTRKLNR